MLSFFTPSSTGFHELWGTATLVPRSDSRSDSHLVSPLDSRSDSQDSLFSAPVTLVGKSLGEDVSMSTEIDTKSMSPLPTRQTKRIRQPSQQKDCKYWAVNQECKYGKYCAFRHMEKDQHKKKVENHVNVYAQPLPTPPLVPVTTVMMRRGVMATEKRLIKTVNNNNSLRRSSMREITVAKPDVVHARCQVPSCTLFVFAGSKHPFCGRHYHERTTRVCKNCRLTTHVALGFDCCASCYYSSWSS